MSKTAGIGLNKPTPVPSGLRKTAWGKKTTKESVKKR